jgi:steroid delta-isomerase-like uncharacterized protein
MRKSTSKPVWRRTRGLIIVGLLILCVMVGAFAVSASPSAAATKATLAKNLTAYMAAWNVHNPAKAATYLAKDATFLDMTVGTPVKGRENIKNQVIAYFINACPDCKWTRDKSQTLFGKNKISYVWTYTGTNTQPWDTKTPATNKSFRFSGQTFIQFTTSGKILHEYDYYDALGFYKQLGWL